MCTPLVAQGRGDPHYTTFDNRGYTLDARGERLLFGVNIAQGNEVYIFNVQGRLDGPEWWRATTTKALAFGVPGMYAYQVRISARLRIST